MSDVAYVNPTATLRGIEALRAIAALAVVAYHAAEMIAAGQAPAAPRILQNGAAGVDVFFVISGFVMVTSACRLHGKPLAAWLFLRARLHRIVPLYWLCSGGKVIALLAAPALAKTSITIGYCVASLLFLPVHDAAGRFRPVLPVGWTLCFEMLFYLLFTASLALRCAPSLAVPPVLAFLALLKLTGAGAPELGNPIILEFAFGTTLAAMWLRGWRLPAGFAWPMLTMSLALLAATPGRALGTRLCSWGIPAALLVAATVSLEDVLAFALPKTLLALGAASYAIYLTHGFVLNGLAVCLPLLPPAMQGAATILPVALAACALLGWGMHVLIEKPLLGRAGTTPRSGPVVLVLAGGGLSPLSGGVGTLMRNLMESWSNAQCPPRLRLADTRGQGGPVTATLRFAYTLILVAWLCLSGQVDLIHAHMTTRGSAARKTVLCALAMAFGVPVIVHMHGADFMPFHRRLHPALRWPLDAVLRRARHVVVLGTNWRNFLVRDAGIDAARIAIVPNGVPRFPVIGARRAEAPPRLLFLGRLCARKGLPDLIAALAVPTLRERDWQATLAGDGNAAPYRAMLSWHGLQHKVSVPGWVGRAETQALLAQADILVLPSHHEAMPLAIIEALAAGVAVITTPVGVIPEFLRDGTHALLVTPGAPAELAAAILRLLNDPALRVSLARAGHAVFRERFEIGRVSACIADLYLEAIRLPASVPACASQAAE